MTGRGPGGRYSARRALMLGFGGTAVLIGGVAGWSVLASVSGAVIATGRVAVETRNKTVEHVDGGTVSEILVRDGDRVRRGDTLLRLDDERLRAQKAILETEYFELAARRNRLEAEFRGADAIAWDGDLARMAARSRSVRDVLKGQKRLFEARKAARAGETARLRERIGQAREEISGLRAQLVSLDAQAPLIGRELGAQRTLFEKGLSQLPRLLALERAAENLKGRQGAVTASIARARGKIAEYEIGILQIGERHVAQSEGRARDVQARENRVRQRLAQVRSSLGRMEVRAPVSGEVFGLRVFAPGEVVQPGETILKIVPEGAKLVVMARIDIIDVDQVRPGQEAVLRFSAFPSRRTPEFAGRVVRVSADAVGGGDSGVSWYDVELAIGRPAQSVPGGDAGGKDGGGTEAHRLLDDLEVVPGMPVEVHIRTRERSVASFLMKPATDFFQRSLREE